MAGRFFEDFATGEVISLGSIQFTDEEIIHFANQWDPQYFHNDPALAGESSFGGLVASGWHTMSAFMRLYVDNLVGRTVSLGSPGMENLRWKQPVRPGVSYLARVTVLAVRPSGSRPGWGIIRCLGEVLAPDDSVAMSFEAVNFLGSRDAFQDARSGNGLKADGSR